MEVEGLGPQSCRVGIYGLHVKLFQYQFSWANIRVGRLENEMETTIQGIGFRDEYS